MTLSLALIATMAPVLGVSSGCQRPRPVAVELVFRDLRSFPTGSGEPFDEWTALTRQVDFNDFHYRLRKDDETDAATATVVDEDARARQELSVKTYVVNLRLRRARDLEKIERAIDKARGRVFGPRGERVEVERVAARVLHESGYLRASLRYTVTGRLARPSDVFIVEGRDRLRWASAPRLEQWSIAVEPEPGTTELLAGAIRRDTGRTSYFLVEPATNTQRMISEDDFRRRYRERFGESFAPPRPPR
ncbi:MAG: hypothetical protein EA378_09590 [Phycisphaerales bacterium]|nr:MAG: hypothetical protein EA378_09590 [Phycisphaerales bacterium]